MKTRTKMMNFSGIVTWFPHAVENLPLESYTTIAEFVPVAEIMLHLNRK